MALFHLSEARWEKLKSEGYSLFRVGEGIQVRQGENTYHINRNEEGICSTCKRHYKSIAVNSPAELEMLKHYLGA